MGAKRDARGKVKASTGKHGSMSQQSDDIPVKTTDASDDPLWHEIMALGGTKQDLELVADIVSDDGSVEALSPSLQVDKKLEKDLRLFSAGLGFDAITMDGVTESEELEDKPVDDEPAATTNSMRRAPTKSSTILPIDNRQSGKFSNSSNSSQIFAPRPDWHATPLPAISSPPESRGTHDAATIPALKQYAEELWKKDMELYISRTQANSSHRFMSTIMTSGTLSDKVSALTLVIQESPLHSQKSFDSLLNLAKKRSRGQAISALGAIKDLLGVGVVLPSDRHLRTFAERLVLDGTISVFTKRWTKGQALPEPITQQHLVTWIFEDWLRDYYFEVLKVLETWCNDEVEYARVQALNFVYELLRDKPEQESNLLRLLVNKLGDPEKKIASRASYLLLQLQTSHPLMKSIITQQVESEILLRPGQNLNAKYYAITTLNQTVLSSRDADVAQSLLNIYFGLFTVLLKLRDTPIADLVQKDTLNRKGQIQGGGSEGGRAAAMKMKKALEAQQAGGEMREKMLSAVLTGVHRAFPFAQCSTAILDEHMDSLFKITHSTNFSTSVQALLVIEQLVAIKHTASDRFYRTLYESLLDPRLISTSKHAMYLNLLFRAIRSDANLNRVKAFVKRLSQILTLHEPPFICAAIYLLREVEDIYPSLRTMLTGGDSSDSFEEDVFEDADKIFTGKLDREAAQLVPAKLPVFYDGRKRDPLHSRAELSSLWDMLPFTAHFHPSVALFADSFAGGSVMPPKPDLASHTTAHFLDRFVYRNTKAGAARTKGISIMQPLAGDDKISVLRSRGATATKQAVNTEGFWSKKIEDIDVEDAFFHRYFTHVSHRTPANSQRKNSAIPDSMAGPAEDDEDEVWQALVQSRPDIEGDAEELSDMDSSANISDMESQTSSEMEDETSMISDADALEAVSNDDASMSNEHVPSLHTVPERVTNDDSANRRKRRRDFKRLPTFASVAEYAALIDDNEDEDPGGE